jgi:hypothetical protein
MWRVVEESVSMERLDGETILINFETGQYFSFRGGAADVLWLVQTGVDRAHWSVVLVDAFPSLTWDEAREVELDTFLVDLAAVGVISPSDAEGGQPEGLPMDYERGTWTPLAVSANDDLADLLVIDPIHEASEDGWPQSRSS